MNWLLTRIVTIFGKQEKKKTILHVHVQHPAEIFQPNSTDTNIELESLINNQSGDIPPVNSQERIFLNLNKPEF